LKSSPYGIRALRVRHSCRLAVPGDGCAARVAASKEEVRSFIPVCEHVTFSRPLPDRLSAGVHQGTVMIPGASSSRIPATLIPGDGIGPEITQAVVTILDALGTPFDWDRQEGGMAGIAAVGDPLPPPLLASIARTRLALKGPLTTPVGGGFRSVNVRLREEFKLFANVRPARTFIPGGRYDNIDLVLIRENLEGLYVGFEHYIPIDGDPQAAAISSGVNTRAGSRRIAEFAFDYAARNGRKKVTIVHKANVLKALTGIFLEAARDVAKKYEGRVAVDDRIVDACAMQLVLDPWQFDMIVTTNLFGDILSDEIAGLVGGLGMAPGANIGEGAAIFEAVHGSAPDIAGKGIANPLALLLAAAMMLDHAGRSDAAVRLRAAIERTLCDDGVRTGDLGGRASTKEFTAAIVRRLTP
jgi:isocitrate dehydrogenase (NAD+)